MNQHYVNLIVIVLLLIVPKLVYAQPQIHFDSSVIYLGMLPKGSQARRTITFTNVGDEPLVIYRLWGSDGGMVFGFRRDTIEAGEQGEIQVNCITEKRAGYTFRPRLQVFSNAGEIVIPVVAKVMNKDGAAELD